MKRFLYFIYYLIHNDWAKFRRFLNFVSEKMNFKKSKILVDIVFSCFRYNIAPLDYFYFRFFQIDSYERSKWAGTGYLYEYQLQMNPRKSRSVLQNKIEFLEYFHPYINRKFTDYNTLKSNILQVSQLLSTSENRLVLKGSKGQVGREVEVFNTSGITQKELLEYMQRKKYDLAEEYVVQHKDLMDLSPSGLNTVRIITQIQGSRVHIIGARLRISVNSAVDNMAAGNLAAAIDVRTGKVAGPGVYSDITKEDEKLHPITGKGIINFLVPYWTETIELANRAALQSPDNKSVGWDIAITETGPELIEGNHNWCKLLWQLPVKKGLKQELVKYLK